MFLILGYGIFRNFWIWDIGIYFGIRVKLILGYGVYWIVYFGIWDIAYPHNQASLVLSTLLQILSPPFFSLCVRCKFTLFRYGNISMFSLKIPFR